MAAGGGAGSGPAGAQACGNAELGGLEGELSALLDAGRADGFLLYLLGLVLSDRWVGRACWGWARVWCGDGARRPGQTTVRASRQARCGGCTQQACARGPPRAGRRRPRRGGCWRPPSQSTPATGAPGWCAATAALHAALGWLSAAGASCLWGPGCSQPRSPLVAPHLVPCGPHSCPAGAAVGVWRPGDGRPAEPAQQLHSHLLPCVGLCGHAAQCRGPAAPAGGRQRARRVHTGRGLCAAALRCAGPQHEPHLHLCPRPSPPSGPGRGVPSLRRSHPAGGTGALQPAGRWVGAAQGGLLLLCGGGADTRAWSPRPLSSPTLASASEL